MPKDEFDFEDPFELNGVAFLTQEDTTDAMAECFIEEFMRMGHNHKQILALFRNPHYVGPNLAYQKRGEPFICELITGVFERWGRTVAWTTPPSEQPTESLSHCGISVVEDVRPPGGDTSPPLLDPMGGPIPALER